MKVFLDIEGCKPDYETFRAPPADGSEYIETRPYVEMPDDTDLSQYIVDGGVLRVMTPSELAESLLPPVPFKVSMRQARLALLDHGLLSNVDTAIASLAEPQKSQVQIEWEYSQEVERERPFVALLGGALGLDDSQLDSLFRLAETL